MDLTTGPSQLEQAPDQRLVLKLFVVGGRPETALAISRLRTILREHGFADSSLQIFDIEQRPEIAREAQVVGVPTLIKEFPLPRKIVVGDLSKAASVLGSLVQPVPLARRPREEEEARAPRAAPPPSMGYLDQKTVRVMLVGFSLVVGSGLRDILSHGPWIEVVSEAIDEDQALHSLEEAHGEGWPIHVVLTEGVRSTRLIKSKSPETAVLVLSEDYDPGALVEMIAAGAAGCMLLQDISTSDLLEAVHGAVQGKAQIKTSALSRAVNTVVHSDWKTAADNLVASKRLSEKESEVLRLLAQGDSNKAIAETLGMTLNTTKKHVGSIIKKLSARNRTHAAIIALQMAAGRSY